MQVAIPWNSGFGSITLTFSGSGNGAITVTSPDNNLKVARSQTITVKTLDGTIVRTLTISQQARPSSIGNDFNNDFNNDF